jgi:hypothetical protein
MAVQKLTSDDFRRIALGMTGAIESSHMDHPDFRVNGRIFATLHGDLEFGMVKLTPEQQARFIGDAPKAFAPESGAWGRSGCTAVRLDKVDEEALGEALTLAFQNATAATPGRRKSAPRSPRPRAARRP